MTGILKTWPRDCTEAGSIMQMSGLGVYITKKTTENLPQTNNNLYSLIRLTRQGPDTNWSIFNLHNIYPHFTHSNIHTFAPHFTVDLPAQRLAENWYMWCAIDRSAQSIDPIMPLMDLSSAQQSVDNTNIDQSCMVIQKNADTAYICTTSTETNGREPAYHNPYRFCKHMLIVQLIKDYKNKTRN